MIYEPYASRKKKNSSARDQKCHHELLSVGCFTTGRRDIMDQLPYRLIASILYCDNFVCGGNNISSYSTERQSQKWQHTHTHRHRWAIPLASSGMEQTTPISSRLAPHTMRSRLIVRFVIIRGAFLTASVSLNANQQKYMSKTAILAHNHSTTVCAFFGLFVNWTNIYEFKLGITMQDYYIWLSLQIIDLHINITYIIYYLKKTFILIYY